MATSNIQQAPQELASKIGREGERLLQPGIDQKLDRKFWDVGYFRKSPPRWAMTYRILEASQYEPSPGDKLITYVLFGWIDVLHWLLRATIFPFVWAVASMERLWARRRGVFFFCPICHNSPSDPLPQCPKCGQVQGALRPRVGELFYHDCTRCGETRWPILGQYRAWSDPHLICRNSLKTSGCFRPNRIHDLLGGPVDHLVLMGLQLRSKHAVLAYLLATATRQGLGTHGRCQFAGGRQWKISRLEGQLAKAQLRESPVTDTSIYEKPSENYTLGRTVLLTAPQRRLFALHNLAHEWLGDEERLFQNGYSLVLASHWFIVLDLQQIQEGSEENPESATEVFTRVIRVYQQLAQSRPTDPISKQLTILLPIPDASPHWQTVFGRDPTASVTEAEVREYVRRKLPTFYQLVYSIFRKTSIRFFGGRLPDPPDPKLVGWMGEVCRSVN